VKRLGSGKGDADEIKAHPFFASIIWEEAEKRLLFFLFLKILFLI